MQTIWYIAKKDLLQVLKDRSSFILLLAVPLVLITVIGLAFENLFGSGSSQITISVAVSNQDGGSVGTAIVNALKINTNQLEITVNQYQDTQQVIDQI
ncbi:MAG TPA: ABC transporter permease, partial [Ktedonobacteraceae bacterium]|nr:ABC transporter permease [Ktedonobacteraceae bacterium]